MATVLTDIDKNILRFMLLNGAHFSEYEISKRLRLGQSTVNHSLRKLENSGAVLGYKYRLNPVKAGYPHMAWCFVELGRRAKMEPLMQKFLSNPNIFNVLVMSGGFDVILKLYLKSTKDLNELLRWFGEVFKKEIEKTSFAMVTRKYKINQVQVRDDEPLKLSELQKDILRIKLKEPNLKLEGVAKRLSVHRNPVASHWRKLWKDGVILKKSVIISPEHYQ
jgi:Lrp/AsnC family transcriptional regulator for asnA, asnC and gidA